MGCCLFEFQNEAKRASDAFYRMRTFAGYHLSNADNDGFTGSIDEKVEYCSDCLNCTHEYDEGRAALVYDEITSKSLYRFKYNHKKEYAKVYGRIMTRRGRRPIRCPIRWDRARLISA